MSIITRPNQLPAKPPNELSDTGFFFSIGPAVDLTQLQDHMNRMSRKPLDDPTLDQIP